MFVFTCTPNMEWVALLLLKTAVWFEFDTRCSVLHNSIQKLGNLMCWIWLTFSKSSRASLQFSMFIIIISPSISSFNKIIEMVDLLTCCERVHTQKGAMVYKCFAFIRSSEFKILSLIALQSFCWWLQSKVRHVMRCTFLLWVLWSFS